MSIKKRKRLGGGNIPSLLNIRNLTQRQAQTKDVLAHFGGTGEIVGSYVLKPLGMG